MNNSLLQLICVSALLSFTGCGAEPEIKNNDDAHAENIAPTNRTPIPARVRQNLGITFAKATYRAVNEIIAVPGSFELLPSAQHHYPLPLAGRITIHVQPLQKIKSGDILIHIDAPEWRELQLELSACEAEIETANTQLIKAASLKKASLSILKQQGADSGNTTSIYDAQERAAIAHKKALETKLNRLLAKAATISGVSSAALSAIENNKALWQRMEQIAVRATQPGIVQSVKSSSDNWHEAGVEIIHAIDPKQLRFHGQALQTDLSRLRDGQQVSIKVPNGHADSYEQQLKGSLRIGVSGDSNTRLIDVFVNLDQTGSPSAWIRPQVAAIAEIAVAGTDAELLAIPVRGVISDGLDKIIFRRDPRDPDLVIRMQADLGVSDGEWVHIKSGIAENNEVVIDGIYELKLATTASKAVTGHFHADGTFHSEDH